VPTSWRRTERFTVQAWTWTSLRTTVGSSDKNQKRRTNRETILSLTCMRCTILSSLEESSLNWYRTVQQAKIEDPKITDKQMLEVLRAFKFVEGAPVLVMAGARESGRGKFLAGLARAAFRSDAVIIDSGVETGIENYCLRRSKLVSARCKTDRCLPREPGHYAKDKPNSKVSKPADEWPYPPVHDDW